jgi:4-hydroxy-2-oxoheptanedioate aldolase
MRTNSTKARLASGDLVCGVVVRFPAPALVEMFGLLGFDFVMIDCEHGGLSLEGAEELVRAADAAGVTPILRVPYLHPKEISRALDIGAQGVQIPDVNTAEEARAAVQATKYTPLGRRGMGMARAGDYGITIDQTDYIRRANDETMIVAHIESAEAVRNLPQMVAVDGIDVFFFGPADLSQSLGHPGRLNHPDVQAAIDVGLRTILGAGKIAGIYAPQANTLRLYRDQGMRYLMVSADNLIRQVGRDFLATVRG